MQRKNISEDELSENPVYQSSFCNRETAINNIDFSATKYDDSVDVHLKIGNSKIGVTVPFDKLEDLREWLEDLVHCTWYSNKQVNELNLPVYKLTCYWQTVDANKDLGLFSISKRSGARPDFTACVNVVDFIKGFYLVVMNALGFDQYPIDLADEDTYPLSKDRIKLWHPYNTLKSARIENIISPLLKNQVA